MGDVARLAGVSTKSVSNYYNGYRYMREDTRQRIEAAISELDYRMNLSARNLRSGKTGMIMLAIPELDQSYLAELAQAVVHKAEELGLGVLIETTGGRREREIEVLEGSRGRNVDGVIYEPVALGEEDIRKHHGGFPIVLMGEKVLDGPFDHVTMPDEAGTRTAVSHLVDIGCRNIALIGLSTTEESPGQALRRKGYIDALTASGLEVREQIMMETKRWHRADGAAAMNRLLESKEHVDAVFAMNDSLALGAMWAADQRGVLIPQEIAFVGFDDTEDATYSIPSLTTVSPGRDALARAAVTALHRRISDPDYVPGQAPIVTDYELIKRRSTTR
ncbi:LacI family transcriptional regulator [Arthrobacter psychrolactophilus]|uniref:LacI family transcriptional regulator n=2 Tax=Arthrobacter psychrolactophilus TaxID=92442 RepID=A0A2V5IW22_9MICC|nr:LacI family transcriptional regulator [Arthrobacter psychrolactophilus]